MTPTDPLEIVAPSASLDPLAPWFGARTSQERALAATFWTSLGGLSGLFHATAIFFSLVATLLPIPFFSEACSSVKPVSFRPPERVEVAIVKVEPLPVVEELEPPPELEEAPAPPKGAKAKKLAAEIDKMNVGMLALLGTTDSVSGVFGTLDSGPDSAVFGALIGDEIGDSFGVGGLGLSGVGVTGGVAGGVEGGGSIGLGGLGTLGHAAGSGGGSLQARTDQSARRASSSPRGSSGSPRWFSARETRSQSAHARSSAPPSSRGATTPPPIKRSHAASMARSRSSTLLPDRR